MSEYVYAECEGQTFGAAEAGTYAQNVWTMVNTEDPLVCHNNNCLLPAVRSEISYDHRAKPNDRRGDKHPKPPLEFASENLQ